MFLAVLALVGHGATAAAAECGPSLLKQTHAVEHRQPHAHGSPDTEGVGDVGGKPSCCCAKSCASVIVTEPQALLPPASASAVLDGRDSGLSAVLWRLERPPRA